jgi:hypothetical protein
MNTKFMKMWGALLGADVGSVIGFDIYRKVLIIVQKNNHKLLLTVKRRCERTCMDAKNWKKLK